MNYTCIGDTVNVAARLQSEARAGEILLSGSTYEAVRDSVEVEELGSIHVKNRAEPVPVYKVVRLRPEAR
jgi:adenylate cyclase